MNLEQRTTALLALIEQHRLQRGQELMTPAREEARATVRAALADARQRVRRAIDEERKRRAAAIGRAEAALATELRQSRQRRAVHLLESAWPTLRKRLQAQWNDPASRRRWITAHVGRAIGALPSSLHWRIEHAPTWTAEDDAVAGVLLDAAGVTDCEFVADARIDAGLRVIAGRNVVDATGEGLLADRTRIEGRLLHHLCGSAP
jgi:hypothetical protein